MLDEEKLMVCATKLNQLTLIQIRVVLFYAKYNKQLIRKNCQ